MFLNYFKLKTLVAAVVTGVICFAGNGDASAQVRVISASITNALLARTGLGRQLQLSYPACTGFVYDDKTGRNYCVLTESIDGTDDEGDTLHHNIKAVCFQLKGNSSRIQWSLRDHVETDVYEETTLSFWTRYTELKDFDGDGIIDPVIVYGSFSTSGYDDGRIKILVYYKGRKAAVRHQNSSLDDDRKTQVDKEFYTLPAAIQKAVSDKMSAIEADDLALFPHDWQKAMQQHKTSFQ